MSTIFPSDCEILRAMLDNTGTHLAYLDRDFNFVRVNSAYMKGSGHCEAELLGRNHFELFPNAENRAIFERARDTGEAVSFQDKPFAYAGQPKLGVTYWDWTLTPIKDNAGAVHGLVLSLIDRTRRKKTEEALNRSKDELERRVAERTEALLRINKLLMEEIEERRKAEISLKESEDRFRAVTENAPQLILVVNADGTIRYQNTVTSMLGYDREEVIGRNIFDFIHPDDVGLALTRFGHGITIPGYTERLELRLRYKSGGYFYTEITSLNAIQNPAISGVILNISDITGRKKAEEELRQIPLRLVHAQEQERRNIGRELHDQTGQYLTALKMLITRIKGVPFDKVASLVDEARTLTDETIQQVRDLSLNLRPPMLDDLGLPAAILWQLDRVKTQMGIDVNFRQAGLEGRDLSPDVSTAVFRIIQEAITNSARYSGAKQVAVEVEAHGGKLFLKVEDKGRGFDPRAVQAGKSSGLANMRERAMLLGGRLAIDSAPGMGTTVTAEIPLENTVSDKSVR